VCAYRSEPILFQKSDVSALTQKMKGLLNQASHAAVKTKARAVFVSFFIGALCPGSAMLGQSVPLHTVYVVLSG
jgi:hypothetical protein